jgi:hypothetical protein
VGVGEWVADGLRVAVEYSFKMDYPKDPSGLGVGTGKTGTGVSAHGFISGFTYEW